MIDRRKMYEETCDVSFIGSECEKGLNCDPVLKVCKKLEGEKCTISAECISGFHCDTANPKKVTCIKT
jgi:hypothetical protein